MKKQLEVGKDYYYIFSSDNSGSRKMVYNGGITWTAIYGNSKMTMDCQKQTDAALEYINRAIHGTGIKYHSR